MNKISFHLLRVGLAVTFLWIGVLILKYPEAWGGYMQPWAANLLPVPLKQAMFGTAMLDIAIGFFLLISVQVWIAAFIAAAHLVIVMTVSGITDITARDVGLLAASAVLVIESLPVRIRSKIKFLK